MLWAAILAITLLSVPQQAQAASESSALHGFIERQCKLEFRDARLAREKADYYTPLILRESKKAGVSPRVVAAIIWHESNFRPRCVSSAGALGLMQVIPFAGRFKRGENPFDPAANIRAGIRIYKQEHKRFRGDLNRALVAYNAGPALVVSRGWSRSRYSTRVLKTASSIR